MQEVSTANFRFEHMRRHLVPSSLGSRNMIDGGLQSARVTCLQCSQSWDAREGQGLDANGKMLIARTTSFGNGKYLIVCCPNCGNGESIKAYIFNSRAG